jgi:hypothetical protein
MLSASQELRLKHMTLEVGIMSYIYKYNKEHNTLEQYKDGMLRACMQMPQSDLNKLARLNIKENILRVVDTKLKTDV